MESNIRLLLEYYTLGDILEQLDIPEEDILEHLLETSLITWEELTDAIPMPLGLEINDTGNDVFETNECNDLTN